MMMQKPSLTVKPKKQGVRRKKQGKAEREKRRIEKANDYNQAFNHGFNVGRQFGYDEAIKELNEKIW